MFQGKITPEVMRLQYNITIVEGYVSAPGNSMAVAEFQVLRKMRGVSRWKERVLSPLCTCSCVLALSKLNIREKI